jgi:hypothetical protein
LHASLKSLIAQFVTPKAHLIRALSDPLLMLCAWSLPTSGQSAGTLMALRIGKDQGARK